MLTFMTYRLLVKARQSYRQETQLLLQLEAKRDAKHAAAATAAAPAGDDGTDFETESTPLLLSAGQEGINNSPTATETESPQKVESSRPVSIRSKYSGSSSSRRRDKGDVEDPSLTTPLLYNSNNGGNDTRTALDQQYSSSLPVTAAAVRGHNEARQLGTVRRSRSFVEGIGDDADTKREQQEQGASLRRPSMLRGLVGGHFGRLHSINQRSLTSGQSFSLFQVRGALGDYSRV